MDFVPMRAVKFAIEDEKVFKGFVYGYWNGWLCPLVTESVHKQIIKFMDEPDLDEDQREALDYYANQEPNEDGLYDWGGCYIWEEVK